MPDFQSQVQVIIAEAAGKITALVQQAAVASLTSGLAGLTSGPAGPRRRRATPNVGAVAERSKGAKRPKDELAALQARVLEFIVGHPGLRVEQINAQLGTTTADLALPLRNLIAAKAIRTKGKKRATTYFAASGGVSSRWTAKRA